MPRAGRAGERRLRGLHGPPPGHRGDRASRTRRSSSSTTTCDYADPRPAGRLPDRAVRDAVLVRQLDFNQQHDLDAWKGFYMYRNLFVVHLRYGENVLVRLKPWLITARGGAAQPAARRPGRGPQRDPRHARPRVGMRRRRRTRPTGIRYRPTVDCHCANPHQEIPPCLPRSRRRRLRLLRPHHRRTLRHRARPEGPRPRASPPPRRQRLQRGRARDRHRGARLRRTPLPHLQREGLGVRQPVHRPSRTTSTGSSASTRGRSTPCR